MAGPSGIQATGQQPVVSDDESHMELPDESEEDTELQNNDTGTPTEGDHHDDDAGWKQALGRRAKRKLRKEAEGQSGVQATPEQLEKDTRHAGKTISNFASRGQNTPRRRLPPLPKGDIKIIMRPARGLPIKEHSIVEITKAIAEACKGGRQLLHKYVVRPRNGSNILIVSTPDTEAADELRKITKITLRGVSHDITTYVAFSEEEVRGVVHGFPAGTTPQDLMDGLRIRTQNTRIIQARMLGKSKTALITFEGNTVPKVVYYYGGEMPCFLYRPTRQVCHVCMKPGHRSDVCPTPNVKTCHQCLTENPVEGHKCPVKCALCGEPHLTAARECAMKLRRAVIPPGNQNQRKSRRDLEDDKYKRQRWLSSEWPRLEKRSKSLSPSKHTVKNQTPEHNPRPIIQNNEKKVKKKKLKAERASKKDQVSWPNVAASLADTNTKVDSITSKHEEIIEQLQNQIARQNAEIAELKKQVLNPPRTLARSKSKTTTISIDKISSQPPPLPQPPVPDGLLQDPSGIGLYLIQIMEVINSRFDALQKQVDEIKTKGFEIKRKLSMPENIRKEKQQILEISDGEDEMSSEDE